MAGVIQKPDAINLSGNLKPYVLSTALPVTFVLKKGSDTLLSQEYIPSGNLVEIDVRDVVESALSFTIDTSESSYVQTSISGSFTAIIDGVSYPFVAVRGGVDNLSDTAANWLKLHFMTWQSSVKHVTYYSPEWLTYFAVDACVVKLKATYADETVKTITVCSPAAGAAVTMNMQFAHIAGKLGNTYPQYYEVWAETAGGVKLSESQLYAYSEVESDEEQWFIFENSLGGLDSFRAFGSYEMNADHTHNVAEFGDEQMEYLVDTERKFKKNTGYLNDFQRRWLMDFFPSLNKLVYHGTGYRKIVVSESNVSYTSSDLPSEFEFTFQFADAKPLLNLIKNETTLPDKLVAPDLSAPDFIIPPRLSELPRIPLAEGVLIPAFNPASPVTTVTSFGAVYDFIKTDVVTELKAEIAKIEFPACPEPGVYDLIKVGDVTVPSDQNVYSAARAVQEFLSTTREGIAKELITFEKGIVLGASGAKLSYDSATNSLKITKADGTALNLMVSGGSAFHSGSPVAADNFAGIPIDGTTLYWDNGVLKSAGSGGALTSVRVKLGTVGYDSVDGVVSLPAYPTTLPANGGNADSLGNIVAADYWHNGNSGTSAYDWACKALVSESVQVGSAKLSYDTATNSLKITKADGTALNLMVSGGSAFHSGTPLTADNFAGIPIDNSTIYWENGILKSAGSGGGLSSVRVNLGSVGYDSVDGVVNLPAYPTMLPASDVSAWAKAATKPTYTAAEVGALESGGTAANSSALGNIAAAEYWHSGNAGTQNFDWTCKKLTSTTGVDSVLLIKNDILYGRSGFQFSQSHLSGTGENGNTPELPQNHNWHSNLILNHSNAEGYYQQLSFDFFANRLFYKTVSAGVSNGFVELWHSGNSGTSDFDWNVKNLTTSGDIIGRGQFNVGASETSHAIIGGWHGRDYTDIIEQDIRFWGLGKTFQYASFNLFARGCFLASKLNIGSADEAKTALHVRGEVRASGEGIYSSIFQAVRDDGVNIGYFFGNSMSNNNGAYMKFKPTVAGSGSAANRISFDFHGNDDLLNIYAGGNVSIGKITADYKLDVNGIIRGTNLITTQGAAFYTSDMRKKSVVEHIGLSLLQIANAPAIRFEWKNDKRIGVGGSAQYTESLVPELVMDTASGKVMDYATTAYLFSVNVAKELYEFETDTDRRIRELETEVKRLKRKRNGSI